MTRLVGILNLTPDSFSGDGAYADDPRNAVDQLEKMFQEGAGIVDVGAESTRPGATPLNHEEEWHRLSHFLGYLKQYHHDYLPHISIDTRHAETAKKALTYGVGWINDVRGFQDAAMIAAVKDSKCDIVVMHSLTIPADPQVTLQPQCDVMLELKLWAGKRLEELAGQGIAKERIILDPGVGFGKTAAQSRTIIERIGEFKDIGQRVLVGHSRKSFLASYENAAGLPPQKRDELTAKLSAQLVRTGVDYIRVHNIGINKRALDAKPAQR